MDDTPITPEEWREANAWAKEVAALRPPSRWPACLCPDECTECRTGREANSLARLYALARIPERS